jgi:hemolysin III
VSIPAGVLLVLLAPTARARIGTSVFAISMITLFGISSSYHVADWTDAARARMQAFDHSAIFLLIAGTYTPFCLLVLHGTQAIVVLSIVWSGAALGILTKLYRTDLHVFSGFMYIGLGWVAVATLPSIVRALTPIELVLLLTGGVLYTLGALTLATRWPDPWPKTFGYHEVWHAVTVAAVSCHYAVILLVVLGLR